MNTFSGFLIFLGILNVAYVGPWWLGLLILYGLWRVYKLG